MKLIVPIFILAIIASVGCSKYNHGLIYLAKKYKTLSPKYVKLSEPITLMFSDTIKMREAMNMYNNYVAANGIKFYQEENRILLGYDLKDSIDKPYNNGIRISKGLYKTWFLSRKYQNQIIQFINLKGITRDTDKQLLVLNDENGCPYMCDMYFMQTKLPEINNGRREDREECWKDRIMYDDGTDTDPIRSTIIPKSIIQQLFKNNVLYFNLYNGITTANTRIIYLLAYDASGKLQINDSYSLDETYMCPNYCDDTEYSR